MRTDTPQPIRLADYRPPAFLVDEVGYRFLVDQIILVDGFNPKTAARLVEPLGAWRRLKPELGARLRAETQRLATTPGLSKNVLELAAKALA